MTATRGPFHGAAVRIVAPVRKRAVGRVALERADLDGPPVLGEDRLGRGRGVIVGDRADETGDIHVCRTRNRARRWGVRAAALGTPVGPEERILPLERRAQLLDESLRHFDHHTATLAWHGVCGHPGTG
jgi:hypothetical protein